MKTYTSNAVITSLIKNDLYLNNRHINLGAGPLSVVERLTLKCQKHITACMVWKVSLACRLDYGLSFGTLNPEKVRQGHMRVMKCCPSIGLSIQRYGDYGIQCSLVSCSKIAHT